MKEIRAKETKVIETVKYIASVRIAYAWKNDKKHHILIAIISVNVNTSVIKEIEKNAVEIFLRRKKINVDEINIVSTEYLGKNIEYVFC